MANQSTVKAVALEGNPRVSNKHPMPILLVDVDGNHKTLPEPAAAQADSTATDAAGLVEDFNALLAKLRAAGLLDS